MGVSIGCSQILAEGQPRAYITMGVMPRIVISEYNKASNFQ